nr:S-adenosyl-L-methionine-dependent methyltransferases superfamily protein [Tanacetum cinerariifolium]
MDPSRIQSRLLHKAGYITYLTVYGIVLQTIAQRADKSADENNIRLGITLGAIVVNLAADLWALTLTDDIPHNHWKIIVFKIVFIFTGILSPYAAFSMLAPDWFTWYVFVIICTVITLYKCCNVLKSTFIWAYEKVVDATHYLIGKLSELIWGDQLETNAAPPPRASV